MNPKATLDEVVFGYQRSIILLTAAKVGLFAALGDSWRRADDVARQAHCDARAVEVVMLALAADGVLEQRDQTFRIASPYAPYLLPDGPETQASIINHQWRCMTRWSRLSEVVRTGRPVPRERPQRDAQELEDFICGMADISRASSREVAEKFDLSGFRRLLDLGGGPATAAIEFARRHRGMSCVVFDLEGPVAIARRQIAAAQLEDRVQTRIGDYERDDLGAGFDAVYVSNIIHSLPPPKVFMLIDKTRTALVDGGTLIIKDFFLDETRTQPPHAARFSVNMLVSTEGGRSYTLTEVGAMLGAAGFEDLRDIPVARHSRLLIARKTSAA
jgi:SAM-dependent methyltransferase